MALAPVRIYTKPDCPYCLEAKGVLDEAGIEYRQHDVTADERDLHAARYLSGQVTVPQVFAGSTWIDAPRDLRALAEAGRLHEVVAAAGDGNLGLDGLSNGELAAGGEDVMLRTLISRSDGTRDPDPEAWPILRFYEKFFGFWPNTMYYLHHWPEAYKLFVYCQHMTAIPAAQAVLGAATMRAVVYATSAAQGCAMCMTHTVLIGGGEDDDLVADLAAARSGEAGPGNPYGPFEVAVADLAELATRNEVTEAALDAVRKTAGQAVAGPVDAEAAIAAVARCAASMGFLNVFNDMTGVELEAKWAELGTARGIEPGRVGVDGGSPPNLAHGIPEGGPTVQEIQDAYARRAGDLEEYTTGRLGLLPAWIRAWPEDSRPLHAHLYTELMSGGPGSRIAPELSHLMARVSAIARNHGYLAAVEGFMAARAATGGPAVERVRAAYAAAIGREDGGVFDDRERAALRLAWLSARTPLTTPRRAVDALAAHWDEKEIVQLVVVCSVACQVQRFVAVARPETEPEVARFLADNGLATDPLTIRHP
jgi:glutaredoxin/alkylhydroperoxidase family enzyme